MIETIVNQLNKHWIGQLFLFVLGHIAEPHFITSLTVWMVKNVARVLEPVLIFSSVYLMISKGVPSTFRAGLYDFSLSAVTGAPDLIIPGGIVTVVEVGQKNKLVAGWLAVLLIAMAGLTGYAMAVPFHVVTLNAEQINQLMYWRSMVGLAYSLSVVVTLLLRHTTQPKQPPLPPQHLKQITAFTETVNTLLSTVERLSTQQAQWIELFQQQATDVHKAVDACEQQVNSLQTSVDTHLVGLQHTTDEKFTYLAEVVHHLKISVTEVNTNIQVWTHSLSLSAPEAQTTIQTSDRSAMTMEGQSHHRHTIPKRVLIPDNELPAIPVLDVPGIAQERIGQVISLYLQGMPWRDIPGNYSRTIKPIKEAYQAYEQSCLQTLGDR